MFWSRARRPLLSRPVLRSVAYTPGGAMHPLIFAALLAFTPQAPSPATAAANNDLAAEVQRAVAAYNARDLSYYESALDPQSTYIAEDGGVIAGRDRVLRTFGRIF